MHGYSTWRDVLFVFAVEGAIQLWLAFALATRWNLGRWITVVWCAVRIAWSTYGFFTAALPRWNHFRYGVIYVLTLAVYGAIIFYLLRPSVESFFNYQEGSA